MDENEIGPVAVNGMDKCATIYRSSAVSFVYVCYHCGADFTNIDRTLKHIESHFQVVQITIDEKDVKSECTDFESAFDSCLESENICDTVDAGIDVKAEIVENFKVCSVESPKNPNQFDCKRCGSTFLTKFALRCHLVKDHAKEQALECGKCGKKFKRDAAFKNHLRQHIERGEVDWKCEGDGVREQSSTVVECSEQQENIDSTVEVKHVAEKPKPEKRKPKEPNSEKVKAVKRQSRTLELEEKPKPVKKRKLQTVPSAETITLSSTYICHKCSNSYNTSDHLNEHLTSHSTSDILQLNKCKECKIFFPSAFDLRLHVLEIHLSLEVFKCSSCFLEFKKEDKVLLEKHLQLHMANNTAKWVNIRHGVHNNGMNATCFEEITTTAAMSCEFCEEKFYLKSNQNEHTRCMHWDNENKLRCPQAECDTVFDKTKFYFAHQFEHRRVGATITETDMKVLVDNLNSYIAEQFVCDAAEDTSNRYKCSICFVEKNSLSDIRLHVRDRHVYKTLPQPIKPIVREKVTCNVCGMAITRNSFKAHYSTHVSDKKFPCSFCSRVFSKNYSRKTHERMHTGEKPFQCDQCGKRFFSNSLLGAHRQQHDSTTYPCNICGRSFNIPSGYRRHMQTHRKDQSYECTICSKSFNTRVYLTRHLHKHNEKTFQCSFCENKFRSAKGQRQHEKLQHHYEPPI